MEKIDRLGWAAGLSLVSYGLRIGVRANDREALERAVSRLPPGWRPAAAPRVDHLYSILAGGGATPGNAKRYNIVYSGAARIARTLDADQALDAFESDLRLHVAEAARGRVFVHAGVVGWRGRAIVLPGRSFSGKSRLVAALLRAGASYYSDEYAVLDGRGRVHPFPAPLSIRGAATGERPLKCPAEALPGPVGTKPLPLGLVVVSEYRAGARWRPRPLSTGQGLLALLAHTVPARSRPAEVLEVLRRAVNGAPVLRGKRGEAEAVAPALLACVGVGSRRE